MPNCSMPIMKFSGNFCIIPFNIWLFSMAFNDSLIPQILLLLYIAFNVKQTNKNIRTYLWKGNETCLNYDFIYLKRVFFFFCLFKSVRFPGEPSPFAESCKVYACNQSSSLAVWWLSHFDVDKVCVHFFFSY